MQKNNDEIMAFQLRLAEFDMMLDLGTDLIRKNLWENALNAFLRAYEIESNHYEVHNGIGICLLCLKQTDRSIMYFQKAIELNENGYDAALNLAVALDFAGKTELAVSLLSGLMDAPDCRSRATMLCAMMYARKNEHGMAVATLKRGCSEAPDPEVLLALGKYLEFMEAYDDAEKVFNSVHIVKPDELISRRAIRRMRFSRKPADIQKTVTMLVDDRRIDRRVLDEARTLVGAGWIVNVIAGQPPKENGFVDEEQYPEINIIRVGEKGMLSCPILNGTSKYEVRLTKNIVRKEKLESAISRILPDPNLTRYFYDPYYYSYFLEAISYPSKIYVGHDLTQMAPAAMAAAVNQSYLIYDSHEFYPEQFSGGIIKSRLAKMDGIFSGLADLVITVNESIASEMSKRYGSSPKVILNSPFFDAGNLPVKSTNLLKEKLGIPEDNKVLLYQGNMIAKTRNLENIIRAIAIIRNHKVVFVLMGNDYGEKKDLVMLASSLGLLNKRVFFMKPVAQSDLLQYTASADAGIIPYTPINLNHYYCTPNKLFEFIVSGLPILGNDLPELKRFIAGQGIGMNIPMNNKFDVAEAIDAFFDSDIGEFKRNVLKICKNYVWNVQGEKYLNFISEMLNASPISRKVPDYDTDSAGVTDCTTAAVRNNKKLNILIVLYYDTQKDVRAALSDLLYAFEKYADANIYYVNYYYGESIHKYNGVKFDLVIFHTLFFSQRWNVQNLEKLLKSDEMTAIRKIEAPKAIIPQDEFYRTEILNEFINDFGVTSVFSCMPESEWSSVYHGIDIRKVKIHRVLTGYLDDDTVDRINKILEKGLERDIDIGYRAWHSAPWLGRHGMLKREIAEQFVKHAPAHGLKTDISTDEVQTKYGDDWYKFMAQCKYFIGVEGGASLLDKDGSLKDKTDAFLLRRPEAGFDEIEKACFYGLDGKNKLFAISPRHLEAAATKTCQILIEGSYNGILVPGVHYIELKRDFSNLNEVLSIVKDDNHRLQITERTYSDIICSGKYNYRSFVKYIIEEALKGRSTSNSRKG